MCAMKFAMVASVISVACALHGAGGFGVSITPLVRVDAENAAQFTNAVWRAAAWRNERVHGYNVGDVNHDGSLTVADVTMLISYVLAQSGPACPVCADVNGDGNIAVADVTLLISMVLSGAN